MIKKTVTFDWDDISIREARERFHMFCVQEDVFHATLHMSPLKGFHVRATFKHLVENWHMRQKWHDDSFRIIKEIFHEAGDYGEILFTRKCVPYGKGLCVHFEEVLLEKYP
jgi:hypothetical protein